MKLEVSHNEIVEGLTTFLASRGITGFDPKTCQVTFKSARGTGELSAILDTDPAPVVDAEATPNKPATKLTGQASTEGATKLETATEAPKPEVAKVAEPEPSTEAPAPEQELETAAADADGEDNLFD